MADTYGKYETVNMDYDPYLNGLLREAAAAKYAAYDFCMRQLNSLETELRGIVDCNAYRRVKGRVDSRRRAAADEWQSLDAGLQAVVSDDIAEMESEGQENE